MPKEYFDLWFKMGTECNHPIIQARGPGIYKVHDNNWLSKVVTLVAKNLSPGKTRGFDKSGWELMRVDKIG